MTANVPKAHATRLVPGGGSAELICVHGDSRCFVLSIEMRAFRPRGSQVQIEGIAPPSIGIIAPLM